MAKASIVVHGHFYQPPREDPFSGEVPRQPGAAPFHDWNERVHAESYKPNAFATIPTPMGELTVNNFERISFDVGPTLLSWLRRTHRETYSRILEADKRSLERLGHGNAIAQGYHHTILPLSELRDVRTQIRWGLADFRHRFHRASEGMWAPEAAVDARVLTVMIEEGVRFTILAPWQVERWREADGDWVAASQEPIDPRLPYRFNHPDGSGRSLAIFFYDGELSKRLAFENLASSAERFVAEFAQRANGDGGVVHAATDGETYGHHFRFGDLGLAYALFVEADKQGVEVINYGTWLDRVEIEHEVTLPKGGTSWSCSHGVQRWAADCGCSTGGEEGWNQQWRSSLRDALDIVRESVDDAYERLGREIFRDPWVARDHYIDVMLERRTLDEFLTQEASGPLEGDRRRLAGTLLELQENTMSMYTSCGWFFHDIGGIETVQVLLYAARALEILESLRQTSPREKFLTELENAKSNDPEKGSGAEIFLAATRR